MEWNDITGIYFKFCMHSFIHNHSFTIIHLNTDLVKKKKPKVLETVRLRFKPAGFQILGSNAAINQWCVLGQFLGLNSFCIHFLWER